MMTRLNLRREHYTNHLLTFQSVMDLGAGLGAEEVTWHLALDQGQPRAKEESQLSKLDRES